MPIHPTLELGTIKVARIIQTPPPNHNLPPLIDEDALCHLAGVTPQYAWWIVRDAGANYRTFYIDKNTKEFLSEPEPGRNLRQILAPNDKLKRFHARIGAAVFAKLPKHWANYAYMKGRSIKHAAECHKFGEVLIRIDVKDFFPSHSAKFIQEKIQNITGYSEAVSWFLSRLVTVDGKMPQGSVLSPLLSIALNYDMDEALFTLAAQSDFAYTRYADDLIFSGKDRSNYTVWQFIDQVKRIISPFRAHPDKIDVMRNKAYSYNFGVSVTGIPEDVDITLGGPTADGYVLRRKASGVIDIYTKDKRPITDEEVGVLSTNLSDLGDFSFVPGTITVKPKRYYVQSIKRMLGIHLTAPNDIRYPRKKYTAMRLEALLAGYHAENVNMSKFNGRLAYMRYIDPVKAAKIDMVVARARA